MSALDMDVGQLFKQLMNSAGSGSSSGSSMNQAKAKQYAIVAVFVMLIIGLGAGFYTWVYVPANMAINENQTKIDELTKKKNEIELIDNQIRRIESQLGESRDKYIEKLAHFSNSEDLGSLYQSISKLANKYNVIVLNIKEISAPPVNTKKAKPGAPGQAVAAAPQDKLNVKEIKVEVELKGRYSEYMQFKQDLAIKEILLNINEEKINVKNSEKESGVIYSKVNLSTYAIDKSTFTEIINNNDNQNTNTDPSNGTQG